MKENKQLTDEEFSTKYLDVLRGTFSGLNLVGQVDNDVDFYNKQVVDSIEPLSKSIVFLNKINDLGVVVDVGFGGGFPLLALAHRLPQCRFLGVETRRKKANAVQVIAKELGLDSVKFLADRIENLVFDVPAVVTFKAVGTCLNMLSKINVCNDDLSVFFYKGPRFKELEGKDLQLIEKKWEIIEELYYDVPGTEGRFFIGFKPKNSIKSAISQVSRESRNKVLVNLSSFL